MQVELIRKWKKNARASQKVKTSQRDPKIVFASHTIPDPAPEDLRGLGVGLFLRE